MSFAYFILAATAAAAPPAADQPTDVRTGSRLPRPLADYWDAFAAPEVRKVQYEYGECVAKKHGDAAVRFVLEVNEDARKSLIRKVADASCLLKATPDTGAGMIQMKLTGDFMKYTLADALVRLQYGSVALANLSAVPPLVHEQPDLSKYDPKPGRKLKTKRLAELAHKKLQAQAYADLAQYGECVVRSNPANSYALLMTKPETAEESAAIRPLQPAMQNCLDAGQTIKLNRASLRGTIALNYYRLAKAPRVQEAAE